VSPLIALQREQVGELEAQGVELRDTPEGTLWKLKSPEL